jgi:type I restriction enzyme S subunit
MWNNIQLGEVVSINKKNIGKNYPFDEIEYLDTGSITKGRIEGLKKFKRNEAPSRAKKLVVENDIIYSTVRPIQRHYGFITSPQENLVVSTGFAVISCDVKKAEPKFIYYFLSQNDVVNYFDSVAEGSTSAYPSMTPDVIAEIEISLPTLPEQKAIAEVLSSLDDKIDLLHQNNQTLEQLAETLFRKWFVDEAKELGSLAEYVKVQGGYAFKSKDFKESGFAGIVKITNISMGSVDIDKTQFVDENVVKNLDKKFKIKSGDFLIAMTGAEIGKIGIVGNTDKELWVNQRVGKLEARVLYGDFIGYLALKSYNGQEHITNACAGSAQENISSAGIEEMSIIAYEKERTISFGKEVEHYFEKIKSNTAQIKTLQTLRDSLLPKLMSGEIRLNQNFQN